jgi:hypothetical protein
MPSSSDTIIETTAVIDHPPVNVLRSEETNDNEPEMDMENQNKLLITTNSIKKFQPHYLTVSDEIFKQLLSDAIEGGDQLVQCLDTDEKLQVVRQMTEVTNNLHYFDLQQHLWQAYYNLGIKENLWASPTTDLSTSNETNQANMCPAYYCPKKLVEERQQRVTWQKQRTINELQQCLIFLQQHVPQWQPSIDLELLLRTVTECVQKGQQRLKKEFLYRIDIIQLDLNDRRFKKTFYDLQPNQEQVGQKRKEEKSSLSLSLSLLFNSRYA